MPVPFVTWVRPSSPQRGNITITVSGTSFLQNVTRLYLNGSEAAVTTLERPERATALVLTAPAYPLREDEEEYEFIAGAALIRVDNCDLIPSGSGDDRGGTDCGTETKFLLYSPNACSDEGWFHYHGNCIRCPDGAECPGGARAWPMQGYWSSAEEEMPAKCGYHKACPGSIGQLPDYPVLDTAVGDRATDRCAKGYENVFCSHCERGYYREALRCVPCASTQRGDIYMLMAGSAVVQFVLALATVFLPSKSLTDFVGILVRHYPSCRSSPRAGRR